MHLRTLLILFFFLLAQVFFLGETCEAGNHSDSQLSQPVRKKLVQVCAHHLSRVSIKSRQRQARFSVPGTSAASPQPPLELAFHPAAATQASSRLPVVAAGQPRRLWLWNRSLLI